MPPASVTAVPQEPNTARAAFTMLCWKVDGRGDGSVRRRPAISQRMALGLQMILVARGTPPACRPAARKGIEVLAE